MDNDIEQQEIHSVTFSKMDVEGAEKPVLKGAGHLLAQASKRFPILFEAFDHNNGAVGYTVHELLDAFGSQGYSLHGFDRSLRLLPRKSWARQSDGLFTTSLATRTDGTPSKTRRCSTK